MARRQLPLFVQAQQLRKAFPNARCDVKRREVLQWTGVLQPTVLSRNYTTRMRYRLWEAPRVWVVEPDLQSRGSERPPHLYPDDTLCLYLPSKREWSPEHLLADTIIPWALDWLMHYELWLSTGVWSGGGVHPGEPKETQPQIEGKRPKRHKAVRT